MVCQSDTSHFLISRNVDVCRILPSSAAVITSHQALTTLQRESPLRLNVSMLKVVKVGPDEVLPNFCILAIMRVAGGAKLETGTVRPRQSQEENWSTEFSQSRPGHWWGGEMSHHSRLKPLTTGQTSSSPL